MLRQRLTAIQEGKLTTMSYLDSVRAAHDHLAQSRLRTTAVNAVARCADRMPSEGDARKLIDRIRKIHAAKEISRKQAEIVKEAEELHADDTTDDNDDDDTNSSTPKLLTRDVQSILDECQSRVIKRLPSAPRHTYCQAPSQQQQPPPPPATIRRRAGVVLQ